MIGRELIFEVQARLFGTLQGMQEGARLAKQSFITELPSGGRGKIELARPRAIGGALGEITGPRSSCNLPSDTGHWWTRCC